MKLRVDRDFYNIIDVPSAPRLVLHNTIQYLVTIFPMKKHA